MGPKFRHYFVRYICEFVITVIVMTDFDCNCFLDWPRLIAKNSKFMLVNKYNPLKEILTYKSRTPYT